MVLVLDQQAMNGYNFPMLFDLIEIIQMPMDYNCKTERTSPQAALKMQEQSNDEIECKLHEGIQCLQIQLCLLLSSSISNRDLKYIQSMLESNKEELGLLNRIRRDFDFRMGQQLLERQVQLEEESHYRDLIREYQARVYDLCSNIYSKEVDIAVDHMGKLDEEKPSIKRVKQFTRNSTEVINIDRFITNVCQLRQRISELMLSHSESKQIQTETTVTNESSEKGNSSNSSEKENNYKKPMKMLLIAGENSHSKYQLSGQFSDPFFGRILNLLRLQLDRERALKQQYGSLLKYYREIAAQNRSLSAQYGK